ncbi:MAG: hypothetical protein FWD71_02025 [Oscillospiraceae bacterium]|nr:hypothetical protein [Oscillospiraceae bacterium]
MIKKSAFFTLAFFIFSLLLISCSGSSGDKLLMTGNDPNNSIYLHNTVCEDENYIYYGEYGAKNITRMNKKDMSVTELKYSGYNLNVYRNYLYFMAEKGGLYRVNLGEPDSEPELILAYSRDIYWIFEDKLYPLAFYSQVFQMNLDGSDKESSGDISDFYYVVGNDDKYVYAIFRNDIEESTEFNGVPANLCYVSRMTYKDFKDNNMGTREKLFKIYTYIWDDLSWYNFFMVISNGYAYYEMGYGDDIDNAHQEIIRNKLSVNAEREVIYQIPDDERVNLIAVTEDGVYFKKFILGDYASYEIYVPNIKISLDGKIQIELAYGDDCLFFVGRYDHKLRYIKDNQIFLAEE